MDRTDLRYDLDAWAAWKLSGGVTPNGTLGRLQGGGSRSVPGSRPPAGVEIRPRLAALIEGMEILPYFGDVGPALMAVRLIYLRGEGSELKDVAKAMETSLSNLMTLRKIGESALLGWMIAKGY